MIVITTAVATAIAYILIIFLKSEIIVLTQLRAPPAPALPAPPAPLACELRTIKPSYEL
jgi:hypothetical protein